MRERHLSDTTKLWIRELAADFDGEWSYSDPMFNEHPRQRIYDCVLEYLNENYPSESLEGDWDGEVSATREAKDFVWEVILSLPEKGEQPAQP